MLKRKRNNYDLDERWLANYEEAVMILNENYRKPSRYIPEERDLRSWWMNTKKRMNAGGLKFELVGLLNKLLTLADEDKHVNQYK